MCQILLWKHPQRFVAIHDYTQELHEPGEEPQEEHGKSAEGDGEEPAKGPRKRGEERGEESAQLAHDLVDVHTVYCLEVGEQVLEAQQEVVMK